MKINCEAAQQQQFKLSELSATTHRQLFSSNMSSQYIPIRESDRPTTSTKWSKILLASQSQLTSAELHLQLLFCDCLLRHKVVRPYGEVVAKIIAMFLTTCWLLDKEQTTDKPIRLIPDLDTSTASR